MKALVFGLLASFFFAFSFIFNRIMSLHGGSWIWTASLRYIFMVPLLCTIVGARRNLGGVFREIRSHPWQWMGWSLIGFGLFYAPISFSAAYSPAWLVAGTWQFTIIAGSLLVPLFYDTVKTSAGTRRVRKKIPFKGLALSLLVLVGIGMMEGQQVGSESFGRLALGVIPIVIATFAYPLGNRKMMELCEDRLDAYQRVLGMTLCSLPLWFVLSAYGVVTVGLPSPAQTIQSLAVAIFSGVIATVLFFMATDLAKGNVHQLATIEATQSGEVVFTLLGELILVAGTKVTGLDVFGMLLVVGGMILHSFASHGHEPLTTEVSM